MSFNQQQQQPTASTSSNNPFPSSSTSSSSNPTSTVQTQPQPEPEPEPYFDTTNQKWMIETLSGTELEWDVQRNSWVPIVDQDLVKKQQAAYSVKGVNEQEEEEISKQPLSKEERKQLQKNKRKALTTSTTSDSKQNNNNNTAIFISNLPLNPPPTISLLSKIFSKAGLILQDPITNEPRIKLYKDSITGQFKGEGLVVYLQKESVELSIRLFDRTELELGSGKGLISVQQAKWEKKKDGEEEGEPEKKKKKKTEEEKKNEERVKKMGKKAAALRQKLQDWDSSDEESNETISKKFKGVIVLEGMFTLKELEQDATLLLDLKEEVREECENLGIVTNVTLYDKEEKGIMTVRFKEELSAQACIAKMNGRFFAGRTIKAYPMNSKHKFSKSGKGDDDITTSATTITGTIGDSGSAGGVGPGGGGDTESEKEKERLKAYAEWLEKGGE
ncbi:hypothetical protein JCM3765_004692 [Sporobolomyces pararoseus]